MKFASVFQDRAVLQHGLPLPVWGTARPGEKVVVSSEATPEPMAVRYAWADNPEGCNLFNKDGLPVPKRFLGELIRLEQTYGFGDATLCFAGSSPKEMRRDPPASSTVRRPLHAQKRPVHAQNSPKGMRL